MAHNVKDVQKAGLVLAGISGLLNEADLQTMLAHEMSQGEHRYDQLDESDQAEVKDAASELIRAKAIAHIAITAQAKLLRQFHAALMSAGFSAEAATTIVSRRGIDFLTGV